MPAIKTLTHRKIGIMRSIRSFEQSVNHCRLVAIGFHGTPLRALHINTVLLLY